MVHAIYTKLIEATLDKLRRVKKNHLSERGIEAVNKLLDRIAVLNFLDDAKVDRKIEELRDRIFNEGLEKLKEELQRELEILKRKESLFAYLEI